MISRGARASVGRLRRRRVTGDGDGEERDQAVGRAPDLALTEARIGGELRAELRERRADVGGRGVRDHDLGRIGARAREIALERHKALLGGEPVGRTETPLVPTFNQKTGSASRTSAPAKPPGSARADAARGGRSPPEPPLGVRRLDRPPPDQRDAASTLSPRSPSTAGRSVSAATTETIPTRIAPTASMPMIEFGTSSIPNIATTKTLPLKSTARLAVAPDASIASSSCLPGTLLPVPGDHEQRVVDAQREAHAREHVDHEHRELELLRQECRQPERDHDCHDRHQQRYEPGDDRAEHEQQDHESGGSPNLSSPFSGPPARAG